MCSQAEPGNKGKPSGLTKREMHPKPSVSVIFVGRDYTGVELQKDSQQADSLRYSPRR